MERFKPSRTKEVFQLTHLHQDTEEMFVLRGASTRPRVLPVQVEAIKLILAKEFDDWFHECLLVLRSRDHGTEPYVYWRKLVLGFYDMDTLETKQFTVEFWLLVLHNSALFLILPLHSHHLPQNVFYFPSPLLTTNKFPWHFNFYVHPNSSYLSSNTPSHI